MMLSLFSKLALLGCVSALRHRREGGAKARLSDAMRCALTTEEAEEAHPLFASDIPEVDNVTYGDYSPPFLVTFWAPWCPWSRRFVTDGGEAAPIEQVGLELKTVGGPAVLKYNVGGRGAPRVPRPPGFEYPYIPSVWLVTAEGSHIRYEGDPADVQSLAAFAVSGEQPSPIEGTVKSSEQGCMEDAEPLSEIPEIDDASYSKQSAPFLITFWASWCPWSRRFVTDGGSEAPIEQVDQGLKAIAGPTVLKYNVGGRGEPRVPLPPGITIRYIPTVMLVSADGAQEVYDGDPADIDALIAFATPA